RRAFASSDRPSGVDLPCGRAHSVAAPVRATARAPTRPRSQLCRVESGTMTLLDGAPTFIAPSPAARDDAGRARTYEVRTFGCQMNVHDSERLSGSLESAGYVRADDG